MQILAETLSVKELEKNFSTNIFSPVFEKLKKTEDRKQAEILEQTNPTLPNALRTILEFHGKVEKKPWDNLQLYEQDDAWKYHLVRETIQVCFENLDARGVIINETACAYQDE